MTRGNATMQAVLATATWAVSSSTDLPRRP